jgi:phage shock protein PspC (stress-responsive transcriptional regulator)
MSLPTDPQPEPEPEPPPRKLTRSSTDRVVGGVAGGLGRYFNIDPLAVRITFVILAFAGAFGFLAYLICLAFIPSDDPDAPPARWGLARGAGIAIVALAAIAALAPHAFWGPGIPILAGAGLLVYLVVRVLRDDGVSDVSRLAAKAALVLGLLALAAGAIVGAAVGTALGGGMIVAGLVIACGVALVGGAFRGGARWLIVPALVLALPLGVVSAADLEVRGSWGDRTFRPAGAAELADGFRMGVGRMTVDLRDVDFPAGRTDLPLKLGVGDVQVIVPPDLCVTTDASVGLGNVSVGDGDQDGAGVDVTDRRPVAAGIPQLRVIADVGVGAVELGDRAIDRSLGSGGGDLELLGTGTSRAPCERAR